jgi:CO/xanthine dehydrogenase Mo-binding subunit
MVSEMITVGKSEIRKDAWEKVTGRALYTADIPIEGVRFGRIYRSPHHHARIVRIDTSKAKPFQVLLV